MTQENPPPSRQGSSPSLAQPDITNEPPVLPRKTGGGLAIVAILGVLLLALGLYYVWQGQQQLAARPVPESVDPARIGKVEEGVQQLQQRLAQLDQRLDALEKRPAAEVGLAPLEQRVAALEKRPEATAAPAPPPVNLAPLEQRIAALEKRPEAAPAAPPPPRVDLAPIEQRLAALEKRPAPDLSAQLGAVTEKLDALAGTTDQLHAAQTADASKLTELDKRLTQTEQDIKTGAGRAALGTRLQAALAALDAGQPLGAIPGAPEALARFADKKPPTEAELRLAFPAVQARAAAASRPDTDSKSVGERMWLRAQQLVTVREGDKVIVGAPAVGILEQARTLLDAGDLAGAVAALKTLDGGAAAAAADWVGQAQSLLDARAAIAQMARA